MPSNVTVDNLPSVAIWIVAIAQIIFALAMAAIALVMIGLLGQIKELLGDVGKMTQEISGKVPGMMTSVDATLGNVKAMSDDARTTTHQVTGTVNRVAHVAGSVVGRLESPLVKSVGVLTGVAAGVRALRGNKRDKERERDIIERDRKKRRGFLGRK